MGIIVLLLLFPYIDANYFYYNRVEKRTEILEKVISLDKEKITEDEILKAEYASILNEISKQKDGSLGSVFITTNSKEVDRNKFVSGAAVAWGVAFLCIFIKFEKRWYKIFGLLLFALIGWGIGYVFMKLPTIISPICNYVAGPGIQVVLIGILATSGKKK